MTPPEIPQRFQLQPRKLDAATEDVLARILARVAQAGDPELVHDVVDEIERYHLLPAQRIGGDTARRINHVAELRAQGMSWTQITATLDAEEDGAGEAIVRDMKRRYRKPLKRRIRALKLLAEFQDLPD